LIFKNAIKGFLSDSIGSIFYSAISVLSLPFIIEKIGKEIYGDWLAVLAILGLFGLFDLGTGQSLVREIAIAKSNENRKRLLSTFFSLMIIISFILILILLILFSISSHFSYFDFGIETNSILISLVILVFLLPFNSYKFLLIGLEKLKIVNIISLVSNILSLLILIFLVNEGFFLISFLISYLFNVIFSNLVFYFIAKSLSLNRVSLNIFQEERRSLFNFGFKFYLMTIANTINLNLDSLVISRYFSSTELTKFTITGKLFQLVSVNLMSKFPSALFPTMSKELNSLSPDEHLNDMISRYLKLIFHYTIVFGLFIWLINDWFLNLWFGDEMNLGLLVTFAWVLWFALESFIRSLSVLIYAKGDLGLFSILSVIETVLNVILSLFLIKFFGIAGVLFATIFARCLLVFPYILYWLHKNHFKLNFDFYFLLKHFLLLIIGLAPIIFSFEVESRVIFIPIVLVFSLLFFELKGAPLSKKYFEFSLKRFKSIISLEYEI
jgi:O-antigen/teichoic acid export membrane protein